MTNIVIIPGVPMAEREIPAKYKSLQKEYARLERIWRPLHYGVGGTAAVLAAIVGVAASSDAGVPSYAPPLAWITAGMTAIVTFAQPAGKAKAYRAARDVLRMARASYELKEETPVDVLLEAMEAAQAIVRGE